MLHQNEPSAGCHWVHAKAEVKPEDVKKHQIEVYEIISRKKKPPDHSLSKTDEPGR